MGAREGARVGAREGAPGRKEFTLAAASDTFSVYNGCRYAVSTAIYGTIRASLQVTYMYGPQCATYSIVDCEFLTRGRGPALG